MSPEPRATARSFASVWVVPPTGNTFVCLALLANPCDAVRGVLETLPSLTRSQVKHRAPSLCPTPALFFPPPSKANSAQGPPPTRRGLSRIPSSQSPGPAPPGRRQQSVETCRMSECSKHGAYSQNSGFMPLLCHLPVYFSLMLT